MTVCTQQTSTERVAMVEAEALHHARVGIYWAPYDRIAWTDAALSRDEAQTIYSRAYWAEFNRLKCERYYDLF